MHSHPPTEIRSNRARFRSAVHILERLLAVTGLVFIIYHVGFDISVMTSPSMAPTLRGESFQDGDWILTEKVSLWFRPPRRWEVVTLRNEEGVKIMKRVVGLRGERISMRRTTVLVDGQPLKCPANLAGVTYYPFGNLSAEQVVDCSGGYFLLGDNSKDSQDSRFEGLFTKDRFLGRARCIIWPLSRVTWL